MAETDTAAEWLDDVGNARLQGRLRADIDRQQTTSATLTLNRAGGFIAQHVFDLGAGIHPSSVAFTLTARTLDGETFGNDAGDIYAETQAGLSAIATSDDGINAYQALPLLAFKHCAVLDHLVDISDSCVYVEGTVSRYLLVYIAIWEADTFDVYAGANDPSATVRADVSYI